MKVVIKRLTEHLTFEADISLAALNLSVTSNKKVIAVTNLQGLDPSNLHIAIDSCSKVKILLYQFDFIARVD